MMNSVRNFDGEIEFKDYNGQPSGKCIYLQLRGDSLSLRLLTSTGLTLLRFSSAEVSTLWQKEGYNVMVVRRMEDGSIKWMNVSLRLQKLAPAIAAVGAAHLPPS